MRQRNQHKFRGTALESLEDRQLLSHAAVPLTFAQLQTAHVHAARVKHGHAKTHAAAHKTIVPGGPVSQSFTAPAANGKVGKRSKGKVTIPENSQATGTAGAVSLASALSLTPGQTMSPLNYAAILRALTQGGGSQIATTTATAPTYKLNPGNLPMIPGTSTTAPRVTMTTAGLSSNIPGVALPTATGTVSVGGTTAVNPASTTAVSTPATTSLATMPVTNTTPPPFAPGPPIGLFGGVTLSPTDVAGLKAAVDTFASSYTSGSDTAADKAAVDALTTSLTSVVQGVWSETHVASATAVTSLQQATDTFAKTYTGGTNLTQDKAAWSALQSGLNTFADSLTTPGATSASSATPVTASGSVSGGRPGSSALGVMSIMQPVMPDLADTLLNGPALSQSDLATLKSTVDTFAANYTSGQNATRDQSAIDALQTGLSDLVQSRWNAMAPNLATPPTAGVMIPAGVPTVQSATLTNNSPLTAPTTTTTTTNSDGTPNGMG
jgi:hypothetical protein